MKNTKTAQALSVAHIVVTDAAKTQGTEMRSKVNAALADAEFISDSV